LLGRDTKFEHLTSLVSSPGSAFMKTKTFVIGCGLALALLLFAERD
jgi:hypothetical protein